MAVINNRAIKKYSIYLFVFLLFTNVLIVAPKAGHGAMARGHTIKAVHEIHMMENSKLVASFKKLDAAIVEIVQAFGFTS